MKSMVAAAGILSILFFFSAAAFAYETIEVKNGGSIEGVAEFTGAVVPKDKMVALSSETKYCGKSMPAETYLIKDRKIKNVVVYIEEIKAGKAFPAEPVTLTNLKCAFEPHVAVGFKGSKFVERNDDTIFHNIHTYINGKTMYNIGLPEKGSSVTKPLTKSGIIEVSCDSHPWMHGYVYVSENPYAAVTDEKGAFTIDNIPPGTYAVEAWHEALGKVKLTNVKVESGKAVKAKLEFKK
jgi:Polysaccharide lyase family 4, domain II